MLFVDEAHVQFYHKKTAQLNPDCYLESLIYTLGMCEETRRRWDSLYNQKGRVICPEQLSQPWQTGTSKKVTRLAFQLYTDGTPTADYHGNDPEDAFYECKRYSVTDIFCCGFAPYFAQAIQVRYPEYHRTIPLKRSRTPEPSNRPSRPLRDAR